MKILYTVGGCVRKGQNQGKSLGFPTANIALQGDIPEGIYASTVFINGKIYNAVSFVGAAKTFKRTDVNVESYILDFAEDIYDKQITVKLYKFLRGNQAFSSVQALVAQMKKDVQGAKIFFAEQRST